MTLISLLYLWFAGGCGTKAVIPHDPVMVDSVHESLKIITRTEIVPVSVTLDIPEIRELRRVMDSVDVIENEYAVSTVTLHADGSFEHGLETKARTISREAQVSVPATDSILIREHMMSSGYKEIVTRIEDVNVLKWWQKFLMRCGLVVMSVVLLRIAQKMITPHGTTMLALIKKLLKIK